MELAISRKKQRLNYACVGASIFFSALIYYVVFRSQLPWPGYLLNLEWAQLPALTDHSLGSYPSFAFALSMGLISIALFAPSRSRVIVAIIGIGTIGLAHEFSMGTFSTIDVLSGLIGAVIAFLCGLKATVKSSDTLLMLPKSSFLSERVRLIALMLITTGFATGTSQYEPYEPDFCLETDTNGECIKREISGTPVYLSYQDLRSAIKVSEPREMTSVSRIYLYKNMLFINEKNAGIHIIDNSVLSDPQRIAFIEIPGNTEIAIREDNLYADSYIDLVTLDISDLENIVETVREQDIFPYNSRQNIPSDVRLTGTLDRSLGVVVGYK